MNTVTDCGVGVFGGVDTHRDFHVVAATDRVGTVLGTETFAATGPGYRRLVEWLGSLGRLEVVGVEGTGSWGAGLARFLTGRGVRVVEVIRANRQARRRYGKSDVTDAVSAARAVLNGEAHGTPRGGEGPVEALRLLKVARRSAKRQQVAVANQIHAVVVTCPEELRADLRDLTVKKIVAKTAGYRPGDVAEPYQAAKYTLRTLARRWQYLRDELADLDRHVTPLTETIAPPGLLAEVGIGPIIASDLLVTAGTNPDRVHSDAAFAALCGVSAVDASSGLQQRHRLNRGGDRQANAALHRAVIVRLRYHQETRDYMTRRLTEGKTRRETVRCLKRHLARRVHKLLTQQTPRHL